MRKSTDQIEEDQFDVLASMLLTESDRGCAIFGAQLIDDRLEGFFKRLFGTSKKIHEIGDKLFEGYGPLSTLSAKSELAYALGVLSEDEFRNVTIIRKIRNRVAHASGPISFSNNEIKTLFRNLRGIDRQINKSEELASHMNAFEVNARRRGDLKSQTTYIMVIVGLCAKIEFTTEAVSETFQGNPLWVGLSQNKSLILPELEKLRAKPPRTNEDG